MKRCLSIILFCILALTAVAQTPAYVPAGSDSCEIVRQGIKAPYYYCDCRENSNTFAFPLVTEIKDTVWYTATVDDLKRGISAYWFSNCSVTMEVYAFCASKDPTFSMTIGKNQMRDLDVAMINQKLDEMGETARMMAQTLTPHMRVYPNGGTGKVYCYPYDQGPLSTCEDPLPLLPRMTIVTNHPETVYRLAYTNIASTGKAFIHWKQKKNLPCEVWLTKGDCEGEEIGRAQLSDSLHVYMPDSAALVRARNDKQDVWVHVKHAADITGRLYYYNNPVLLEPTAKKGTVCQGKTQKINLRTYASDTVFTDMVWVAKDTLQPVNMNLKFTEPKPEYDTIHIDASTLSRGYRYTPSGTILYEYGDTTITITKANTCTRVIRLTVQTPSANQALDNLQTALPARKQIQDGQVFIIIDDRKYTILGQQIKIKQ